VPGIGTVWTVQTEAAGSGFAIFSPQGVHGPSEVGGYGLCMDRRSLVSAFPWNSMSCTNCMSETYTPQGTFDAVIPRINELRDLGITAIELMPGSAVSRKPQLGVMTASTLSQCKTRTEAPRPLKRLVNACHQQGMAVVLDVVYNHLGPEGNYLADFGGYFCRSL